MSDTTNRTNRPEQPQQAKQNEPGPGEQLLASLRRYRWLVACSSAVGTVIGLLLTEHGPEALAAAAKVAERGWPAVALVSVVVAFLAILRVVGALGSTVQLLHEQLQVERTHVAQTLTRLEDNQEQMTIVLERLVDRTHPGTGAPVTMPPAGPQVAVGG